MILVYALAPLVVTFAVAMGGAALVRGMNDEPGARALSWVGGAVGILLVVDVVLLVGALGVNALGAGDEVSSDRSDADDEE